MDFFNKDHSIWLDPTCRWVDLVGLKVAGRERADGATGMERGRWGRRERAGSGEAKSGVRPCNRERGREMSSEVKDKSCV